MKTNENALILKYSSDKTQLLTSDNKIFAIKENSTSSYKFVTHPDSIDLLDDESKKVCIRVRVCIGEDDNGKCKGWSWEIICEIPVG